MNSTDTNTLVIGLVAAIIAGLLVVAVLAWPVMLIVGALFPTAGVAYWQTYLGVLLLQLVWPRSRTRVDVEHV